MKRYLLLYMLVGAQLLFGQENTLQWTADTETTKASLADAAWIAGHWMGEAFGGITEEVWTPPLGGSMMFVFKLVVENEVQFYEIGYIKEVEDTLILQLKHFHANLKGWEEKDDTVDAKLVKVGDDKLFFDDFTFEKVNEKEMNIYVVIEENGKREEVKFNYKKK